MSQDSARVERAALETDHEPNQILAVLRTSVGRNAGLVVALLLVCVVGAITAGDRFTSTDNALTILRLAATTGVVSIGMTFVIIGGGIDLSVGAIVALSSVWCTTIATQQMAEDTHWLWMVAVALLVGAGCGLVNGILIAYGNVVAFIATLAMLASARGLAEIISDKKTQILGANGIDVSGFLVLF
jgi:ribose transport system permease protein